MVFGEPEELKAFRSVIGAFKQEEPDIVVKLIEAGDLLARLSTSFAGGRPPEAMQASLDLRDKHLVVPSDQEREAEDEPTRFLNGRLAMLMESRRETPSFRTIKTFDWDIAALPRHKQPAGILHSDAYCMTKRFNNKHATWRFLEFALGPEGQQITARLGRTVPSLSGSPSPVPFSIRRPSPRTRGSSSRRSR